MIPPPLEPQPVAGVDGFFVRAMSFDEYVAYLDDKADTDAEIARKVIQYTACDQAGKRLFDSRPDIGAWPMPTVNRIVSASLELNGFGDDLGNSGAGQAGDSCSVSPSP